MEFANVISPLTGKAETKLIEIFTSQDIIALYLSQVNLPCDHLFKNVSSVALYECLATGYKFFYPFTIEGSDSFYQDLVKFKSRYYHERWEHREGLRHIKQNEAWLEVGSGGGSS